MRVLLTGADGYIGTVLGARLLERGHDTVGLDTGFYRRGWLFEDGLNRPRVITKDQRAVTAADLQGFEAVVHLAELSNDPLGENDPTVTFAINHRGSVRFARLCKEAGVARFIYASSCSIYGAGGNEMKTERSRFDPQTAYAGCKVMVEQEVGELADSTGEHEGRVGQAAGRLDKGLVVAPAISSREDMAFARWIVSGDVALRDMDVAWRDPDLAGVDPPQPAERLPIVPRIHHVSVDRPIHQADRHLLKRVSHSAVRLPHLTTHDDGGTAPLRHEPEQDAREKVGVDPSRCAGKKESAFRPGGAQDAGERDQLQA
jgi:hypothetical protein